MLSLVFILQISFYKNVETILWLILILHKYAALLIKTAKMVFLCYWRSAATLLTPIYLKMIENNKLFIRTIKANFKMACFGRQLPNLLCKVKLYYYFKRYGTNYASDIILGNLIMQLSKINFHHPLII